MGGTVVRQVGRGGGAELCKIYDIIVTMGGVEEEWAAHSGQIGGRCGG